MLLPQGSSYIGISRLNDISYYFVTPGSDILVHCDIIMLKIYNYFVVFTYLSIIPGQLYI